MKAAGVTSNRAGAKRWRVGLGVLLLAIGVSPSGRAAIIDIPGWGTNLLTRAEVGYDSRPYMRAGSDGAGFIGGEAALRFSRLHSLSQFEIEARLHGTAFLSGDEDDSLDPSAVLTYRYPYGDTEFSKQWFRAAASVRTEANADVGMRLRRSRYEAEWEGLLVSTGKLTLYGRAAANQVEYETDVFNKNRLLRAGLTAAFVSNDRLQLGAGYDLSEMRSARLQPHCITTRVSNGLTVRGRGHFMPKLSGSFFVGVDYADYGGCVVRTDWDPVAGGSLTWTASERRRFDLSIDRRTYFSPSGDAVEHSRINLDFTQVIAGGFRGRVGMGYARASFREMTEFRRDEAITANLGLDYNLTGRLNASLDFTYSDQTSDNNTFDYDRLLVLARIDRTF